MKLWSTFLLLAALFSGCSDNSSYVKVVDPSISRDISVEKISERVNKESGLKELQVMGTNDSSDYFLLKYRIVWYDKEGFELKAIGDKWIELPVFKNADFTIHVVAPNKNAVDYRLFINKKD